MIGASKILTVSYGTFSCTLEGFDDPFNTMKAIAEYFRDLAAEDRYFGAEPPVPDAAMLSRIAERELHRRVEAKVEDHGVVLRAAEAAPQRPAPQPVVAEPAASGLLAEESVAAKLQRIRAAVARSAAVAAAAPAAVIEDAEVAEDEEPVQAAPAAAEAAWDEEAVEAAEAELREVFEPEAVEVVAAEVEAEAIAEVEVEAEPEVEAEAVSEVAEPEVEIAEAAAVAGTRFEDEPEFEAEAEFEAALPEEFVEPGADDLPEDVAVEAEDEALIAALSGAPAEPEDVRADDLSGVFATLSETPRDVTPYAEAASVSADEDDLDEALAAALEAPLPEEAPAAASGARDADDGFEDEDWDDAAVASELPVAGDLEPYDDEVPAADAQAAWPADPEAPAARDAGDAFEEADGADAAVAAEEPKAAELKSYDDEVPADAADAAWPADPEAPATETGAGLSDKLRRARARVIKVRRPAEEPLILTNVAAPEAPVEAGVTAVAADEGDPEADAARRSEGEGRTILESTAKGDEDLTRLLRQTNSEMEGAESKRRMSTLAHLKAAVAATVAELRAPSPAAGTGEPSRLERYRADLAKVVRPRKSGDQPPTERPAPLVLVSEQRIDRASNTDASPTRVIPRRVSAGNLAVEAVEEGTPDADNIFASSRSFAEFAERLGATELPDLLEAAAAYTACVEGQPSFSRPQLMRHVSAVTPETDAVREDSMRSFGQLLRQGKIEKVKRGQFAITDTSYYLAEARRMVR